MHVHIGRVIVLGMVLGAVVARAAEPQEESRQTTGRERAKQVQAINDENQRQHGKDPQYLVRPGVLANRSERWVKIWARATALSSDDPVEFLLIPQDSGKDYEAMAVAYAKPSDVHAAIEFIGLKPGRPVNYVNNQYWPRGERVIGTVEWVEPPADPKTGRPTLRKARLEELIVDTNTNKPMPLTGFVFAGSYMVKPEGADKPMYAADVMDPKSIISDFNEIATVLDVPRQAPKSVVYGFQKVNPAFRFTADQFIVVQLTPERTDGVPRVRDLALRISGPAEKPADLKYALTDAEGKSVAEQPTLVHALAVFERMVSSGQDPFVTVQVDDALSLGMAHAVFSLLSQIDNEKGIRVDAPPAGHLYYRAFFPKDEWRDRARRLGRPWELHLVEKGKQVAGTLILPADEIDDNNGQGDLKFTVGTPQEMAKVLAEKSNRFSQIVYIFAPRTMTYGHLMTFIRPSMKTHPGMYVFLP